MNIFSSGISNKNIPAQFVVWIITLKICWCDDSNYGWYFICAMLTVWINQTKDWTSYGRGRSPSQKKLRQQDRSIETFLLQDQDRRPESHCSLGESWRLRYALSGALTHFSPLLPTRGRANSHCNSKPRAFIMKFVTPKERQKAKADASNSGSEMGGEWKCNIQIVSCPLYGVSSETKVVVAYHGLCLRINWPGSSSVTPWRSF